jgi:alkaline phosphatase
MMRKHVFATMTILLALFILTACSAVDAEENVAIATEATSETEDSDAQAEIEQNLCSTELPTRPKNIFLFIGDGMGFSHISVTEAFLATENGVIGNESLSFTQLPVMGMVTTYSANSLITCSAAAGTALATGVKTNNEMLGVDVYGRPLRRITSDFRDEGFRVGIATTTPIDHATPAAFFASGANRYDYASIVSMLPSSGFEFFAGNGFLYTGDIDGRLERAGYFIVHEKEDLANAGDSQRMLIQSDWPLVDFTRIGIERLSNPNGFFFMAEGGRIDWEGHSNNTEGVIREMIDFSEAVAVALEFYRQYPNETLIIVTSDHGTGGIALGNEVGWTTGGHTGEAVPLFAIGVGSELFAGRMDNTDIPTRLRSLVLSNR